MCDCLQTILDNLTLEDDFDNEKKEAYTLIHCTPDDWKNIEIPITNSSDQISSDSITTPGVSNDSIQIFNVINNWNLQCFCNNIFNQTECKDTDSSVKSDDKFNIVATRVNEETDDLVEEEVEDEHEDAEIECTLAIIKPEAMKFKNEIEKRISDEGFEICERRILQLTPEQASELYYNEYGKLDFPLLAVYMSSGPICALVLAKPRAVKDWRRLMGPKDVKEAKLCFPNSIRAKYGEGEGFQNAVHGSLSQGEAVREIHFFFPNFIVEPLPQDNDLEEYLWKTVMPVVVEGLTHLCREKPKDPVIWLADWIMENDPTKPKILEKPRKQ